MRAPWFRKPKPDVQVANDRIMITYHLTNGRLVAHSFTPGQKEDQKLKVSFSSFRSLAWETANAKAKELGWIA
jgi:hypothetical protein